MQAQVYDGYRESNTNWVDELQKMVEDANTAPTPKERTVYNTPWLNEFNRLLEESGDEVLRMEDFPRANFTREHLEVQP